LAPQTTPAVGGCWRREPESLAELVRTLLFDSEQGRDVDEPQQLHYLALNRSTAIPPMQTATKMRPM
jgi:hypothetical protein